MNARLFRGKAKGQSIPIIALMIVVLVAMVGLAVDVGNTYAEQRNTQRATNAAALAAMNNLIAGGDDASVYKVIVNSLKSNNITVAPGLQAQPGERLLIANYLDESGNPLQSCPNVGSNCPATVLQGVKYVRVNVGGKVDTYFARVVGRPDLPVEADAWAARGVCLGIYPIGIRESLLGANGFVNPDSGAGGTYNDSIYRNKTAKTISLYDSASSTGGGFVWLRWSQNASDAQRGSGNGAAVNMFTGTGNIAESFNEAPWPLASGSLIKPTQYPQIPGQMSNGDWVYQNRTVSNDSALRNVLNFHKDTNKTVMILPIWDVSSGQGDASTYHVSRLGAFALMGYSLGGQIKVAYLGNAPECSTLRRPPDVAYTPSIVGQVLYQPRFFKVPSNVPPVQYEIILDVSGSMSWSYDGKGWRNNTVYQCTGANSSCSGSAYAWRYESERRIYFAKNAIKSFIDQMKPNDTMKIIAFTNELSSSFSDSRAVSQLTTVYPSGSTWGQGTNTTTKNTLKSYVDQAGASGDKYKTDGRTPSPVGLARGIQEFQSAPTKSPVTNTDYRRVVIFLTDGVANIKRNGQAQTYSSGCGSEIASCNIGPGKPITQAGAEANTLKDYATVYVIAMAGVDEAGLPNMASAPNAPFYSTSQNGGDLEAIFKDIAQDVQMGNCVPDGGTGFVPTVKEDELGTYSPPLTWPTVGYAYLKDANGGTLPNGKGTAPIQVNADTGLMTYRFNDVSAGNYLIEAWISVKGQDDVSRVYKVIYNPSTGTNDTALSIFVDPALALGTTIAADPLHLDLMGSVCP